jgi:hypothetical protein
MMARDTFLCCTREEDVDGNGRSGRRAIAPAAAIGLALLAAACGGGSSRPLVAGDTAYQIAAAYARCMRSHGAPNWPDPNSAGQFVKTLANRAEFQAPESAYRTCRHLLPHGGQLTTAEQQKIIPLMLKFTACMRAQGIADFPDPVVNSQGITARISPAGQGDLDPRSPRFQAARQACQKYMREAGKYIPPG